VLDKVTQQHVINCLKKQDKKAAKDGQRKEFLNKMVYKESILGNNNVNSGIMPHRAAKLQAIQSN